MMLAIVVGIFLLNMLIVEISRVYTEVTKFGRFEFWTRRLAFMNEIACSFSWLFSCAKSHQFKKFFGCCCLPQYKTQRFDFSETSKWVYRDFDNSDYKRDERNFFFWYRYHTGKFAVKPNFWQRFRVFVSRAPYSHFFLPGETFERVMFCHQNKTLVRFVIFIFYPFILLFLVLRLTPGLLFGIFWPASVKMILFHGPLDENPTSDQNAKQTNEKVLKLEEEICDMRDKIDDINEKLSTVLRMLTSDCSGANQNDC